MTVIEQLEDKIYKCQVFSPEEYKDILRIFEEQDGWKIANVTGNGDNYKYKPEIRKQLLIDLKDSPITDLDPYIDKIRNLCEKHKNIYNIEDDIRFDLLQMQKSKTGSFFNWHVDGGGSMPSKRREFACLVYINGSEDFEGGNTTFRVNGNSVSVEPRPGLAILFKACNLVHRGEKVTSGTKYVIHSNIGWKNWK